MWTPSSAPMLNSRDTCRRPQVGIAAGGEAVEAAVEVVVEVVVAVVATRQVATKRQAHSRAHNQQAVARRSQAPPALPAAAKDPAEAAGARTTGPACKEAGPATRAKRAVLRVAMVAGATEAVVVEVVAVATEAVVVAVVVAVVPVVAGGRDVVGLPKCSEPQTNSSRQLPVCFDRAFRCHGRTHFVGQRVAAH